MPDVIRGQGQSHRQASLETNSSKESDYEKPLYSMYNFKLIFGPITWWVYHLPVWKSIVINSIWFDIGGEGIILSTEKLKSGMLYKTIPNSLYEVQFIKTKHGNSDQNV